MRKESHRVRLKTFAELGERRRIAIHEAGHAVVNHDLGARVNAVEIQISGRLSGNCWATFPAFFGLEERTASYFAGMHAELCFGFEHEPLALRESLSWHDLEALRLMYDREVELHPDRAEEVSRRMAAAGCRAREIIERRCADVDRVAQALLSKGTIDREAFDSSAAGA